MRFKEPLCKFFHIELFSPKGSQNVLQLSIEMCCFLLVHLLNPQGLIHRYFLSEADHLFHGVKKGLLLVRPWKKFYPTDFLHLADSCLSNMQRLFIFGAFLRLLMFKQRLHRVNIWVQALFVNNDTSNGNRHLNSWKKWFLF